MGLLDRFTDGVVAWGQSVVTRVASPLRDERERLIAAREALYRGTQYEGRGLAPSWDKAAPGAKRVPLRLQKPSVQYDLPKLTVRRVTSMLFGDGRHPAFAFELVDEGPEDSAQDEASEDTEKEVAEWLGGLAKRSHLWRKCLVWSRLGCAAGSGCMVWGVVDGEAEFRPLRSQHCTPTFDPRRPNRLIALELRYKFPRVVKEQARDGSVVERVVDYWHRETWDDQTHTVFADAPVDDRGREPSWTIEDEVTHGLGRVPGVWVRPLDDADEASLDGESIFEGVEDIVEDVDRVLSQKSRALRYNLDPTRVWFGLSERDEASVRNADGPAVSVSSKTDGADVTQLELNGSSLEVAESHANAQRARALETLRVVSPDPDKLLAAANSRVALELLYAPMRELVSEVRATFGGALEELFAQILDAVRSGPLSAAGALALRPPAIPPGSVCLSWGAHFAASVQEQSTAASTATLLVQDRLLDRESAIKWVCRVLGISDASAVLRVLEDEDAQALAASGGSTVADTALNGAQIATARELLVSAANGELPVESISALLTAAFPSVSPQQIAAMLGPIRAARANAPALPPSPPTPPPPPSDGETNPNPAAPEPPSPASSARESDVEDA